MADFNTTPVLEAKATITFNEAELRALEAITGYGSKAFLKVFYEHMGTSYLKPHEEGLLSLFKTLHTPVTKALHRVDQCRDILTKSTKR